MRPISPGASGNWWGLNSQVLYWVAHGESITIASSGMSCRRIPSKSSLHVVLVLVYVAALPEAVAPLGQDGGEAGLPAEGAQPRRRRGLAEELDRQRSGSRARRRADPFAGQIEADPVGLRAHPYRVAAAGEQPRHRRAVALRDAPAGQQLGRAVGPGVAAVGAELDGPPGLVELGAVPRAQARRNARPSAGASRARRAAVRPRACSSSATRSAAAIAHLQTRAPPTAALERQRRAPLGAPTHRRRQRPLDRRQLLARHHALGELDEVVVHGAVGHPGARASGQPPLVRGGWSARTAAARSRPASGAAAQHDGIGAPRARHGHAAQGSPICPAIPCRR